MSISASDDPSHVLHAKVVEVAEELPLDDVLRNHPGYRDLDHEAHAKGLLRMEAEFQPLLIGRACPRCRTVGRLELNQIHMGTHVRY